MKNLLLILITSAITSVYAQSYKYLGDYTSNGTPLYLESEGDIISIETQEMISNSLPESYPVPDYNPQYITSGYDTDIKLDAKADVWVTFVSEGAGYRNTLGFYTYNLNDSIQTKPAIEDITIIFPNVSALGSGGGLKIGDKVKIGTFEEGTGIGWVLLANAWSKSAERVGHGLWKLYSNPNFNPESDASLKHHNVLLADPENERIILGFEDIRRDYNSCDNDFNDAIFYITANPYEAINILNAADISSASNVTSAFDGGLESNGNLASLIAKRNFKRTKYSKHNGVKSFQKVFTKNEISLKLTSNSLATYLPETGMYKTEVAKISSPEDLLTITNAKEIFSVDYYDDDKRIAAILATATEGKIYDHSKVICDRLNGSSLEDVRTVITRGHKIISSKIKRATGEVEYSLSFSIKIDANENELFSFWNIEQYPTGNFYNYQIWGSSFSQVFSLANFILDKHTSINGLKSEKKENILPNVFVKSGNYANGFINLNIVNKTKETEVTFTSNIAETEIDSHREFSTILKLSGAYNQNISVKTGVLFDIGFSLATNLSEQKDALYLADGPWGLDYLNDYANISNFKITASEKEYSDQIYTVDRNASASGLVKGNVNLFRHILPGEQTLDVTEYQFLNFKITNNEPVEIVIMQDDTRDWKDRLRYTIPVNNVEKSIQISLNDFKDAEGNTVAIKNMKTIVYSVIGDYTNFIPFTIDIKDLNFNKQSVLSTNNDMVINTTKLTNYPNPFTKSTIIKLPDHSEFITIKVFDLQGKIIDNKRLKTVNSKKEVIYNTSILKTGIYKYLIKNDSHKICFGTFIVK